jgi:hypothetical protein
VVPDKYEPFDRDDFPPGALRRLPDAKASHRAYPENRFVAIKLIHIYPEPL